ncbi:MAG TPA: hypothetical protein DCS73_01115 [Roseburia sp.]|nr:hypothetical protein [Roseburia sp.]
MENNEEKYTRLFAAVEEVIRSSFADNKGMRQFLDFQMQVPGYSIHNTAMIMAQRPDALKVQNFRYWKSKGLYVHAGEQGIAVLVPAPGSNGRLIFKMGYVFDMKQTNAGPEKIKELLSEGQTATIEKEKIKWLITELRLTTENETLKRYLFYNIADNGTDIDIENRLQVEIVNYMVYRYYGFNMESHSFPSLEEKAIRDMKISDKKNLLQHAKKHADEIIQLINSQIPKLNEMEENSKENEPAETEILEQVVDQESVSENIIPEKEPAQNKIEDFGKKIGGARKDLWKDRGLDIIDIQDMNTTEAAKYITKDNIWKKPDYMKLMQEGMPVHAAFFMKEVRNALPVKVTYTRDDVTPEQIRKRQEDYIHLIQDVKEMLFEVKTDPDIESFFFEFTQTGKYIMQTSAFSVTQTEEGYAVTNRLIKAMQMNLRSIDHKIAKEQFGVSEDEKLPKGFSIRYLPGKQEYVVLKGKCIIADGIPSQAEAIECARKVAERGNSSRKKKFVPKQLEHIKRDGPSYGVTSEKPATGEQYMEQFGFAGGEFGNWMSGKDRQAALNMGYDALMDLAYVLKIDPSDIALGNRLSIAFGARGSGNALAHYEPLREVINLTKMRGAGSLAHEWGHAFDDIIGKKLGLEKAGEEQAFMSKYAGSNKIPQSMRMLIHTMKYRPATEQELAEMNEAQCIRTEKYMDSILEQIFPEDRMEDEHTAKLNDIRKAILSMPEEVSIELDKAERTDDNKIRWIVDRVDELSQLRKNALGHIITKDIRDTLYRAVYVFECTKRNELKEQMVETEFFKNSVKMDALYGKEDKGYWQSTPEMFARAFACYVHDRLPWKSDYLCGHSEFAVGYDYSESEPKLIKAIPEGQEREQLNKCFDKLFEECREKGLLKAAAEISDIEKCRNTSLQENGTEYADYVPQRRKVR